jgi:hypothetical protein
MACSSVVPRVDAAAAALAMRASDAARRCCSWLRMACCWPRDCWQSLKRCLQALLGGHAKRLILLIPIILSALYVNHVAFRL